MSQFFTTELQMIPGLLDSQIKGMSGREIAEHSAPRILGSVAVRLGWIDGVIVMKEQANFIAILAELIDDIRAADKA